MTTAEKITILTANIRRAEEAAQRALTADNEFSHRMQLEFAEQCRAELRAVQAAA